MEIHHQDGSKALVETLVVARRTKANCIALCFKSNQSAGKGIVILSPNEVAAILVAAKGDDSIDDVTLFKMFANISPIIRP